LDVADTANMFAKSVDPLRLRLDLIGRILMELKNSSQRNPQSINRLVNVGETVTLNFKAMSIYVDNSQNGTAITFISDNRVRYTVAANSQTYIHPMGIEVFDTEGSGIVPCCFIDTFLPIK